MAVETGLKLRTAAPMGDWRSFVVTVETPGVCAGQMALVHNAVGVYVLDGAAGDEVAFIYHAEKIKVPKLAASAGLGAFAGDKVYYSAANAAVTPVADANLWIGIFVKDCLSADTEALIDLKGDKAHS